MHSKGEIEKRSIYFWDFGSDDPVRLMMGNDSRIPKPIYDQIRTAKRYYMELIRSVGRFIRH